VPAALCSASLSNMAGVLISPVLVSLMLPAHGGLTASGLGGIAVQILAPFIVGQMVRPWIGSWLLRIQP
jgi:sodium/bile acid cotransporter 7